MMRFRILRQLLVFSAILPLSGCLEIGGTSSPSRFYLLEPLAVVSDGAGDRELGLGVGPIRAPGYLDRPQIVTRSTDNQIQLAEFDRWGEPLRESVSRVLAANLGRLVGTERVQRHPWRASRDVEIAVEVDVERFDGERGGSVVLDANWRLRSEGAPVQRAAHIVEETRGGDYADLAAAMSRALARLSTEMATAVSSVRQP
jgi:uncharacterized lipoprotein YmbA